LHGHSVGGTNPSLLRAIGAGAATIAYNVNFNRDVLADSGRFFDSTTDVAREIEYAEKATEGTRARGRRAQGVALRYDWDDVAARYRQMCERLAARGPLPRRLRPSGLRKEWHRHPGPNGSADGPDRRAATGHQGNDPAATKGGMTGR
jgi:hypothetical protein